MLQSLISSGIIGLSLGTQYALLSIGFTLIFGILGVVNFAHGGFYIIGGYLAYSLSHSLGMPYFAAIVVAALATGALGYVIEVLVVDRHVADHLTTMLITLGVYQMMTTGVTIVYGAEPMDFPFPVTGSLHGKGFYLPYSTLVVLGVCTVAISTVYLLIFKTRYGIALRAMADDRPVARALGIPPARMFPMAFAIATALSGLTGALVTPILSLEPHSGEAVLGKAFIVGLIEAYTSVFLGGSQGALALFIVVVVLLLVRPNGLLGTVARKA